MMIQEFEKLTGLEVSTKEYAVIEELYYDFDGDKQAFCKKFVKENGLVEVLRMIAQGSENELLAAKVAVKNLSEDLERTQKQLERELEWKPWTPENITEQSRYDHLKSAGRAMTDDEAKEWISGEFGFAPAKIRINRRMKTFEINRHHELRQVGEIERDPYYDATDWYYVFFTVCGMDYEAYNGSLKQI